ncbi:MAG: fumarylacetoacetate hydrolase family protein [Flavobacteriaceae bacterium]|jgi:2-keto-4-pentenoate hydratase/2-oxohepta-3-ene-1,7-dioic acid hydratase in catechol pathway|nr:fumarylacetoacetate hydrolase family protein [Flavobacteriaceae bacterium]MDP4674309.1 fumarylacetoacetate hydrolase family protein [Flavobacteriaceae bacterium]MDP4754238.1 fumarylacetoacetate hydrolase family protein [Flavobacteriaceae bacterium]MDP4794139.1 fumarylacetoacetate hydrolase family protein [Flavobacteriaceae bacterium]MDP4885158.1 fumarylacetoacetate hydrolase family protein [Flavobacteriaceae bacterium]
MKLICIGRNYVDHIEELNNERPAEPVVFIKPDSSVLPKEQDFYIPSFTSDVHHEVEVLVKIKKVGKHIDVEFAHTYYDEIGLGIDFTARDVQQKLKDKGLPWEKAKGFDGAAVIGQWVDKKTLGNLGELPFGLVKNGQWVQQASTALMLWSIDELIAHVSTYFTLKKGDIIFTGTPAGVSRVQEGDVLEGYIGAVPFFKVNVQ